MSKKYVFDLDEVEARIRAAMLESIGHACDDPGQRGAKARLQMAILPVFNRALADEFNRGTASRNVATVIVGLWNMMAVTYVDNAPDPAAAKQMIIGALDEAFQVLMGG